MADPTSTTQPKLLPCPFCGAEARKMTPITKDGVTYQSVYCLADDCVNPKTGGLPGTEAFDKWNTRAALSRPADGDGLTMRDQIIEELKASSNSQIERAERAEEALRRVRDFPHNESPCEQAMSQIAREALPKAER